MKDNVSILINDEVVETGHNAYAANVIDTALFALTQNHGGLNPSAYLRVFDGATILGNYPVTMVPSFGLNNSVLMNYVVGNLEIPDTIVTKLQLVSALVGGRIVAEYNIATPIVKTVFVRLNVNWRLYAYGRP